MKKLLFLAVVAISLVSCKKDDEEPVVPSKLELTVSYYYNSYQGYKKDVDAKAFLFEEKYGKQIFLDSMNVFTAQLGLLTDKNGKTIQPEVAGKLLYKYSGTANVDGLISISEIEPAKYFVLVTSNGRWTYSTKWVTFDPGKTIVLTKNFYYLDEFNPRGEYWDN